MKRIVFLGPPGAGKGTQAAGVARELGIPHLSTGDILRAAVASGSPLGQEADGYMRAGKLVPDELIFKIVGERLARPDTRSGFLFDGFPRNLAQAETLERLTPIDRVISFEVEPEELVRRLSERRTCPKCQATYHLTFQPPKAAGKCDRDGTALLQRPDDRPEAVAERLRVYAKQTAPLLDFYRQRKLLAPVNGSGTPEAVAKRIRDALR